MAICPNCHAEVIDGARFCQECGTRMTPSMPPQPSPVAEPPPDISPDAGTVAPPTINLGTPTLLVPPPPELPSDESADDASNETTQGLPPIEPPDAATLVASNKTTQGIPVVDQLGDTNSQATRALPAVEQPDDVAENNQATRALPAIEQPSEGEVQRPDNAFRTVFLPSTATEELRKQQEEWHRLAEGEPIEPSPPANRSDQGTPTILTPESSVGAEMPTIATPIIEPLPPINLPPSEAPSPWGPPPQPLQPPSVTGQLPPPAGYTPFGTQPSTPPFGPSAPAQPPANSRRQLYWILGGIGCLLLILLAACIIFFLVVISRSAGTGGFVLAAATATRLPLATSTARPATSGTSSTIGPTAAVGSTKGALSDDFSDPKRSSLSIGDDKETTYAFENGTYAITVKVARLVAWSAIDGTYGDAKAQVDATLVSGPAAAAAALIFRYQDNSNFYVYNVAGDGRYNLEMMRDNTLTTLVDWTPSPAIRAKGETNLLRLETQGDRIALFVNDTKLEETSDPTFSKGQMALAVNTFDEGDAKVVFDNLVVDTE